MSSRADGWPGNSSASTAAERCSRQHRLPRSIHSDLVDHVLGAPARLAGVSLVTRDAGRHFTDLGYTPLILLSLLTVQAKLLEPCPERLELLLQRCQVLG